MLRASEDIKYTGRGRNIFQAQIDIPKVVANPVKQPQVQLPPPGPPPPVILRMSMLTGLQMQLEATINLLCDMTADMAAFDKAMVYFWDEGRELMELHGDAVEIDI